MKNKILIGTIVAAIVAIGMVLRLQKEDSAVLQASILPSMSFQTPDVRFGNFQPKTIDRNYRANTDGFVLVVCRSTSGENQGIAFGFQGTADPGTDGDPEFIMATTSFLNLSQASYVPYGSFTMPVKQGNYWKVKSCSNTIAQSTDVYWMPIRSN